MLRDTRERDLGAVLIVPVDEVTGKMVLEWDPSQRYPLWKFPAGGIEEAIDTDPEDPSNIEKTARRAARRELEEETGLLVEKDAYLISLGIRPKRNHVVYVYLALTNLRTLKEKGAEGEIPKAFSTGEIEKLKEFLPMHLRIFWQAQEAIAAMLQS